MLGNLHQSWLDCRINADCKTGRYTLKVNGREVLKDAGFAEPSSMVYALSLRTGEYRGKPTGRADQDIPNTEEPLAKVAYRIDDVMTDNLQRVSVRTGKYRKVGSDADDREIDLPNAGDLTPEAVHYLDNVSITK